LPECSTLPPPFAQHSTTAMSGSGTKLPILDVCCPVAIEGKADVGADTAFW
jgi:hypothetical protein